MPSPAPSPRERWIAVLCTTLGCGSTSPKAPVRDTAALVRAQSGQELTWLGEGGDEEAKQEVRTLLGKDLTLESAVRISLLSNRNLQALYEELGISQADLVQAGLLKNPSLGGTYRFPLDPGHGAGIEASFVSDLLQLLTRSSRKNIARLGLVATEYRVTGEVLRHLFEVKSAYFSFLSASQVYAMRTVVTEAAEAAVALARRQHEAGTINDLDLANEEALFASVSLDLTRSRAELITARETLNEHMGLWGESTRWKTEARLPELPVREPATAHAEAGAISRRADLAAARKDVEVVHYGLSLAKRTRWIGGVDAGVSYEKKPEGIRLLGPTVSVELPIFDQRQATLARLEAQLRQAQHRETALAVGIRADVRKLAGRLAVTRGVVEAYKNALVPQRERIVLLSQQQYDAMLLGVFQLLVAKQNEIATYREFIEALRDYWILRAELEYKTGGAIPMTAQELSTTKKAEPTPTPHHHEHHHPE